MSERVSAIYLETNVFIYAVEGTSETSEAAKKLIAALRARPGMASTSELALAEVLAPTARPDALAPAVKRRAYLDLLVESGFIELLTVSRAVLLDTADLRSAMKMRLADAIHLASAMRAGCQFFVSSDRDFRRLPESISWIEPNEDGVTRLLRELT
jgi:predicted nucleic acid-binding protein